MAKIRLEHVYKRYGNKVTAVKDFNLETEDGEFVVFVGPSGCGKTTTLRMIAGLEDITEGKLYIGDRLVNDVPPKDRDIAMVFQNYALYPHMNVYENMAFGLRLRRYPKDEIDRRVKEAAQILKIEHLLNRKPRELSGGQRQRVAMGRAIVREPKVFLMDEPLSNLDAKLRVEMRAEIAKLQRRLGVTTIYVTHDQVEAMTLGQRIVVMKDGEIQQVDTPLNLYDYPGNKFVAGFIGSPSMNFIRSRVQLEGGNVYLAGEGFKVRTNGVLGTSLMPYNGKEVWMGIRPEHIGLKGWTSIPEGENVVRARVEVVEPLGADTEIHVEIGGHILTAKVDGHAMVRPGDSVELLIDTSKLHAFEVEGHEKAIGHAMAQDARSLAQV
ncbi:MAG: sn-glycerol-3-phosphate ABC transporter ATP-binding protein UgpC [Meiothermus sp.]|uniref:ABC transporter ATP-binding protein n=1 Tax=Meiothermus sp. TaxID=1955249 RepID=UPI0025DF0569|nr:sn-glycerol-3-phosphate ABC transporter ATP-binding protein UgpC [Meiothermus sp.]MCS7058577.1 sn-glycerol-3-phosphate ABC transporter ATP-binding protein UgpC [Meiothermus sp.]MCS7193758.1 sn-glycerol-3-phosphate ABC transporter ATP-binding protein UgpC [Meiothermus sp.]MDW8091497.1 sn-glycerol-3-phosphate ABC transporter ATP-binding protein UgpC [Meiothermus sp.]MDW8481965.1 sn-glycerol-3-phosphate ABC transporter ATP-binding protein UgpC [Meiothermus sp.]